MKKVMQSCLGVAVTLLLCSGCGTESTSGSGVSSASAGNDTSFAIPENARYAPEAVLVKFRQTSERISARTTQNDISILARQADVGLSFQGTLPNGVDRLKISSEHSVEETVNALRNLPDVEYAEPDYWLKFDQSTPDDPYFGYQWALQNSGQTGGTPGADISATTAWGETTGRPEVIVAVIDTGVDYSHPDLKQNMWINPGEIPGNGIDDDNNGWVDDVHGIDAFANDGDPMDEQGHGTHVAGTIAAVDNRAGVVGVAPNVKIMALRFLGPEGGYVSDAVRCINYAVSKGAHLSNNSWGGGGYSQAMRDAINNAGAANQLFVAAAGNAATNTDQSFNYPSCYDLPNVISVGSSDHYDQPSSFSNYGLTTVDLFAPGSNILSTVPGNGYAYLSGTSMASPHVAGVVALMMSINPDLSFADVREALMASVDAKTSLNSLCATGGRLNAAAATSAARATVPVPAPVVLSSVAPSMAAPGETVTLAGSGFGAAGRVVFQPGALTFPTTSWSDTGLVAVVPEGASGMVGTLAVEREDGVTSDSAVFVIEQTSPVGEPLGTPTALVASVLLNRQVQLAWVDNAVAETETIVFRRVEKAKGKPNSYEQVAVLGADTEAYQDTVPADGVTYGYRVQVRNAQGESAYSEAALLFVPGAPPAPVAAPSQVVATAVSGREVRVSWQDNSDNESGFQVFSRQAGSSKWSQAGTTGAGVTGFTVKRLRSGKSYEFMIRAYSTTNTSPDSDIAVVTML